MHFRKMHLFLLFFLFLIGSAPDVFAQSGNIIVTGTILDENKVDLWGVNVLVKGTSTGTVSGEGGSFSINVPDENAVLVFSFLGYQPQEVPVGKNRKLKIIMHENSVAVEEVVVIAYGTQSKATITGALSSVDTKKMIEAPVASITNVLAGAVPGVTTIQTTGQPGNDVASIFVRGAGSLSNSASSPLILVDGVERSFSQIDPNEIESLSILKDASSTAVFGVRGANGVILVTTKRGQSGKPSISVSSLNGLQQPMSYVKQTNSYEFARYWNLKQQNDRISDKSMYFTPEQIEAYRTGSDPIMYPSVDWGDVMFNKAFLQSKNNINISGGSDNVKYFVSVGYLYQNGVLKQFDFMPYDNNYSYNRYNYRSNLDMKLSPSTNMKLNIGGNVGRTQEPRTIEDISNGWVYAQIWAIPMGGPGIINGKRTLIPKGFIPEVEMRDGLGAFYGYGYNQFYRTTLNLDTEITQNLDIITKGLSASLKGAYDNRFNLNKYRKGGGAEYQLAYHKSYLEDPTKPQTDPDYDKSILYIPVGNDSPLSYSEDYGRDRNWYIEARLNYDRTFGNHKVSGLFLYNQSRDYYPDSFIYIPRSYVGFVGRATYSYKNKYLLDANVGYNGSENFAPGKTRYGTFPSVSAGWIVSSEPFMQNQTILDYLKIRASYGKVGSDLGTNTRFMYMPSVWTSNGSYSFGVSNPNNSEAYGAGVPGNPKVTWETSKKQNYGIDLKALGSRLSLNVDYFFEHRTGILISPKSTPSIIATSLPNLNLGVVDNKGYEIALGWEDVVNEGFSYYLNANISYAKNKILYMDEVRSKYDYQNQTGGSTGRYTGLYKYERLYQYSDFTREGDRLILNPELPQPSVTVYPGDAMYADLNGDQIVDGNDKMVTGHSTIPEYIFGLNGGFEYKGFNFSMQWTGATNVNKLMEVEYRTPYTNAGKRGLLEYFYKDGWTEENHNGTLPRAAETSESWNSENSTLWLRDASYIRLKTVTLGYTIRNKPFIRSMGLNSLNINLSGYNLLTFSKLGFMDPEALANNDGAYPLVKVYSLGVNINF